MIIPGFFKAAPEAERENMLAAMQKLCCYAAERGVTPTVEDFDDSASPIKSAEGMAWFCERIPELRVTFDTGNFLFCGEDEGDAFALLADKIVHIHCKDRSRNSACGGEVKLDEGGAEMYPAAVGSGCIRMREIVMALLERGYKGIFTIEHFGAPDQLEYMRRSAEWLKGVCGK